MSDKQASANEIAMKIIDQKIADGELIRAEDLDSKVDEQIKVFLKKQKEDQEKGVYSKRVEAIKKETRLTNDEFIAKLFKWSVPIKYFEIFRDDDVDLNKIQVWDKIRSPEGLKVYKKEKKAKLKR